MSFHSLTRLSFLSINSLALLLCGAACRAQEHSAPPVADFAQADAPAFVQPATDNQDDRMLTAASTACQAGDARAFFDVFIQSAAVRSRYSAADIAFLVREGDPTYHLIREERLSEAAYRGRFPIRMVDVYYRSAQPLRSGDNDEYVLLELNQSATNRIAVEWTRVHFDGKSEGGDDLGQAFTLDGKPYEKGVSPIDGQLLFEPHGDCWRLISDMRQQAAAL